MTLDPLEYRGTNYTPCIATNFVANLGLIPMLPDQHGRPAVGGGFFDPVHCDAEIAEIAAAGLNSIRIVGSFYGWLVDRQAYLDSLRVLCRTCWQYGVSITYCLGNSTQWGVGAMGGGNALHRLMEQAGFPLLRGSPITKLMFQAAEAWEGHQRATPDANITQYPEPVPDDIWDRIGTRGWDLNLLRRIEEYLKDVCSFFDRDADGREAIGSLDLYNEPDVIWAPPTLPPQPQRLAPVMAYIKLAHGKARRYAPGVLCTIGWAGVDSPQVPQGNYALATSLGITQDYFSFHSYSAPQPFRLDLQRASRSVPPGVPVVCSEFWLSQLRGRLAPLLGELRAAGFGGQIWGFLQHNAYRVDRNQLFADDFDGVRIPQVFSQVRSGVRFSFSTADSRDLAAVQTW